MPVATAAVPSMVVAAVRRLERWELWAPFRAWLTLPQFLSLLTVVRTVRLVAPAVGGGVLAILLERSRPEWATLESSSPILLGVVGFVACSAALRATTGEALLKVRAPANLGLLRAVELGPEPVFKVFLIAPLVRTHAALALATTTWLVAIGAFGRGVWIVLVGLLCAVITAGLAAVRARPRQRGWGGSSYARTLAFTVRGLAAGLAAGALVRVATGDLGAPSFVVPTGAAMKATLTLLLLLAVATAWCRSRMDRLRASTWTVAAQRRSEMQWSRGTEAALAREVRASRSGSLVASNLQGAAAFGAAVLGVGLSGVSFSPGTLVWLMPLVGGYFFVTVLVAVGATFAVVGPTVVSNRLRFMWEVSERAAGALALSYLGGRLRSFAVLTVVVMGAYAALGALTLRPVAVVVGIVAGAVLAESVLPPVPNADGTVSAHPLTALVLLLIAAPALAGGAGWVAEFLRVLYVVLVLGGAHACLSRRILQIPST